MRKIALKLPLLLLISCSTISCNKEDMKKHVFVGDFENSQLINGYGWTIEIDDPTINQMTCVTEYGLKILKRKLNRCQKR